MSHEATNWAVKQRGISPASKIVLWQLCDRYHPDHGCFPSQDTLASDCEMSRRSVNDQLDKLEACGLIRRVKQVDSKTKRRKSTRYILGFEGDFMPISSDPCAKPAHGSKREQTADPCAKPAHGSKREQTADPCAKSAHGAMCKSTSKPCANSRKSHVQNLHTNPVREPVIKYNPPIPPNSARGARRKKTPSGFSASKEALKRIQAKIKAEEEMR